MSTWMQPDEIDLWLRFLGRLHPLLVHFPLALVLVAAAIETCCLPRRTHRVARSAMICLALAAISGAVAAWFGWLNADFEPQGRAAAGTLGLHRWIALAAAGMIWSALGWGVVAALTRKDWTRSTYRMLTVMAAVMIAVAGHFGGTLVRGPGYLTAVFERGPIVAPRSEPAEAMESVDFETAVRPLLVEHCAHCHGLDRQRGGLQLEPISVALSDPEMSALLGLGEPESSPLLTRLRLPAGDPDHMPRDDDPLPEASIAMIAAWLAADRQPTDERVTRKTPEVPAQPPVTSEPPPSIEGIDKAAVASAMQRINDAGGIALPVAADDPRIDVNLVLIAHEAGDTQLALLDGLQCCLSRLNLSSTALTNDGLALIAHYTRLENLRLERTLIDDAGLAHLRPLVRLAELNLYGTAVSDAGLDIIAELPALRRVYLWRTAVTDSGAATLSARRPDLSIVMETVEANPPTPPVAEPVERP